MNYPDNIEEKLGFDRIRQMISDYCLGTKARELVNKMKFSSSFLEIQLLLRQQLEFREILQIEGNFPSQDYLDPSNKFNKIKIQGTLIQMEDLLDLKTALRTVFEIIGYLNKLDQDKYPEICGLKNDILFPEEIYKQLNKIVDEKGGIRDKASSNLSKIRRDIQRNNRDFSKINSTIDKARSSD